jgi:predicted lipid carrier protein YhbT
MVLDLVGIANGETFVGAGGERSDRLFAQRVRDLSLTWQLRCIESDLVLIVFAVFQSVCNRT